MCGEFLLRLWGRVKTLLSDCLGTRLSGHAEDADAAATSPTTYLMLKRAGLLSVV